MAANDFTLWAVGLEGSLGYMTNAAIKRLDGTKPFRDTVLATRPLVEWKTNQLIGPEIPVDSMVTVCAEITDKDWIGQASSTFTRDGADIATVSVQTLLVMIRLPSDQIEYACTNQEAESIVLTDVVVRKHGDPASIFVPGEYSGGGAQVSYTASVTIGPGATETFLVGTVNPNFALSIGFDAARSSDPSVKFATLRADPCAPIFPGLTGGGLAILSALLFCGGAVILARRRFAPTAR